MVSLGPVSLTTSFAIMSMSDINRNLVGEKRVEIEIPLHIM